MSTNQAKIRSFAFHIWERLRLKVGDDKQAGMYSCRISDIADDHLVISRPFFEGGNSLLADNRIVTAYAARADAAYSFTARIKETEPKSTDTMYLVDIGPVTRSQRRRFVRLDITVPLKYRRIPRPISDSILLVTHDMTESHSINLSAGGMMIGVSDDVKGDDFLIVALESCHFTHLPHWLLAACRYVSVRESGDRVAGIEIILREDLPRYLSNAEVQHVPDNLTLFGDKMQNSLVSELFEEQLLMRQKGLL
jgi:c-di-GMP-binding flagellar brake protein YcgR